MVDIEVDDRYSFSGFIDSIFGDITGTMVTDVIYEPYNMGSNNFRQASVTDIYVIVDDEKPLSRNTYKIGFRKGLF